MSSQTQDSDQEDLISSLMSDFKTMRDGEPGPEETDEIYDCDFEDHSKSDVGAEPKENAMKDESASSLPQSNPTNGTGGSTKMDPADRSGNKTWRGGPSAGKLQFLSQSIEHEPGKLFSEKRLIKLEEDPDLLGIPEPGDIIFDDDGITSRSDEDDRWKQTRRSGTSNRQRSGRNSTTSDKSQISNKGSSVSKKNSHRRQSRDSVGDDNRRESGDRGKKFRSHDRGCSDTYDGDLKERSNHIRNSTTYQNEDSSREVLDEFEHFVVIDAVETGSNSAGADSVNSDTRILDNDSRYDNNMSDDKRFRNYDRGKGGKPNFPTNEFTRPEREIKRPIDSFDKGSTEWHRVPTRTDSNRRGEKSSRKYTDNTAKIKLEQPVVPVEYSHAKPLGISHPTDAGISGKEDSSLQAEEVERDYLLTELSKINRVLGQEKVEHAELEAQNSDVNQSAMDAGSNRESSKKSRVKKPVRQNNYIPQDSAGEDSKKIVDQVGFRSLGNMKMNNSDTKAPDSSDSDNMKRGDQNIKLMGDRYQITKHEEAPPKCASGGLKTEEPRPANTASEDSEDSDAESQHRRSDARFRQTAKSESRRFAIETRSDGSRLHEAPSGRTRLPRSSHSSHDGGDRNPSHGRSPTAAAMKKTDLCVRKNEASSKISPPKIVGTARVKSSRYAPARHFSPRRHSVERRHRENRSSSRVKHHRSHSRSQSQSDPAPKRQEGSHRRRSNSPRSSGSKISPARKSSDSDAKRHHGTPPPPKNDVVGLSKKGRWDDRKSAVIKNDVGAPRHDDRVVTAAKLKHVGTPHSDVSVKGGPTNSYPKKIDDELSHYIDNIDHYCDIPKVTPESDSSKGRHRGDWKLDDGRRKNVRVKDGKELARGGENSSSERHLVERDCKVDANAHERKRVSAAYKTPSDKGVNITGGSRNNCDDSGHRRFENMQRSDGTKPYQRHGAPGFKISPPTTKPLVLQSDSSRRFSPIKPEIRAPHSYSFSEKGGPPNVPVHEARIDPDRQYRGPLRGTDMGSDDHFRDKCVFHEKRKAPILSTEILPPKPLVYMQDKSRKFSPLRNNKPGDRKLDRFNGSNFSGVPPTHSNSEVGFPGVRGQDSHPRTGGSRFENSEYPPFRDLPLSRKPNMYGGENSSNNSFPDNHFKPGGHGRGDSYERQQPGSDQPIPGCNFGEMEQNQPPVPYLPPPVPPNRPAPLSRHQRQRFSRAPQSRHSVNILNKYSNMRSKPNWRRGGMPSNSSSRKTPLNQRDLKRREFGNRMFNDRSIPLPPNYDSALGSRSLGIRTGAPPTAPLSKSAVTSADLQPLIPPTSSGPRGSEKDGDKMMMMMGLRMSPQWPIVSPNSSQMLSPTATPNSMRGVGGPLPIREGYIQVPIAPDSSGNMNVLLPDGSTHKLPCLLTGANIPLNPAHPSVQHPSSEYRGSNFYENFSSDQSSNAGNFLLHNTPSYADPFSTNSSSMIPSSITNAAAITRGPFDSRMTLLGPQNYVEGDDGRSGDVYPDGRRIASGDNSRRPAEPEPELRAERVERAKQYPDRNLMAHGSPATHKPSRRSYSRNRSLSPRRRRRSGSRGKKITGSRDRGNKLSRRTDRENRRSRSYDRGNHRSSSHGRGKQQSSSGDRGNVRSRNRANSSTSPENDRGTRHSVGNRNRRSSSPSMDEAKRSLHMPKRICSPVNNEERRKRSEIKSEKYVNVDSHVRLEKHSHKNAVKMSSHLNSSTEVEAGKNATPLSADIRKIKHRSKSAADIPESPSPKRKVHKKKSKHVKKRSTPDRQGSERGSQAPSPVVKKKKKKLKSKKLRGTAPTEETVDSKMQSSNVVSKIEIPTNSVHPEEVSPQGHKRKLPIVPPSPSSGDDQQHSPNKISKNLGNFPGYQYSQSVRGNFSTALNRREFHRASGDNAIVRTFPRISGDVTAFQKFPGEFNDKDVRNFPKTTRGMAAVPPKLERGIGSGKAGADGKIKLRKSTNLTDQEVSKDFGAGNSRISDLRVQTSASGRSTFKISAVSDPAAGTDAPGRVVVMSSHSTQSSRSPHLASLRDGSDQRRFVEEVNAGASGTTPQIGRVKKKHWGKRVPTAAATASSGGNGGNQTSKSKVTLHKNNNY